MHCSNYGSFTSANKEADDLKPIEITTSGLNINHKKQLKCRKNQW